jgi:hypothetical protein
MKTRRRSEMTISENNSSVSTVPEFITTLSAIANDVAKHKNKYASVMARIVQEYINDRRDELALKMELTKLREGFAWTKLKEEIYINEFWIEVENKLTNGE